MASQVHQRGPSTPEMNMTPLIDVTFQLIIFFMLVNNVISEENVPMTVPVLEQPKTLEMGEMNRIIVQVIPATDPGARGGDHLATDGSVTLVKVSQQEFAPADLSGISAAIQSSVAAGPLDEKGQSRVEVVLRADASIRYDEVQPIMDAITAASVGTIHLIAYMPGQGPAPTPTP